MRGAPAMLTENIQPTKILVNGASGDMHSLTFAEQVPGDVVEAVDTAGYKQIVLDEPPLSINFQLVLPDGDDGAGIESLAADTPRNTIRLHCSLA